MCRCADVQMTTVLANEDVPACLVLGRDREGKRAAENDSNNNTTNDMPGMLAELSAPRGLLCLRRVP
jgi:hypothetical protein